MLASVRVSEAEVQQRTHGAKLVETSLVPRSTLVPSGSLVPGLLIPDARLQGAVFLGAKSDEHTTWPKDFDAGQALGR